MADNDVKIVNQRTGEVLRLCWQNEDRPEYMNYMTVNGVKSIKYDAVTRRVQKEVALETMRYAQSIGFIGGKRL